jgi:hypothetical protein
MSLATLNLKDFGDFAEHEGLTIIGGPEPPSKGQPAGS